MKLFKIVNVEFCFPVGLASLIFATQPCSSFYAYFRPFSEHAVEGPMDGYD